MTTTRQRPGKTASRASKTPPAPPAGRHVHGLSGINIVHTDQYRVCQIQLERAVNLKLIAAVHGSAGHGKTFAVDQHIRNLATRPQPPRVAWVEIPHRPRGKTLPVRILEALHGQADDEQTEDRLLIETVESLAEADTVLVVDEASHLRIDGLHQVKHIYDNTNRDTPRLSVVLVGGYELPNRLAEDPQLESRVAAWAGFRPLEGAELYDALDQYHPIFAHTDEAILEDIDRRACKGSFRTWAYALQFVLHLPNRKTPPAEIDHDLAEATIEAVTRAHP